MQQVLPKLERPQSGASKLALSLPFICRYVRTLGTLPVNSQIWGEEVFMTNEQREIQRKLRALQHAEKIGNARKTCRYFGVGSSSFYRCRDAYQKFGEAGLKNTKSTITNFDLPVEHSGAPNGARSAKPQPPTSNFYQLNGMAGMVGLVPD